MEDAEELFARYVALESLVLSLLISFKQSGIGVNVIEEIFDNAAHAQVANADANKGAKWATRALQIIDELREVAVPKSEPPNRANRG